ncbi:MAG: protein phosphatase 2C domain-containing protein [Prochlorotrichaceae cyanobacterium]
MLVPQSVASPLIAPQSVAARDIADELQTSLPFAIATGSVLGDRHRQLGCNNQDAWGWEQGREGTIVVVCDGCGSAPHSEVGAQVGVRFVLQSLTAALERGEDPELPSFWSDLQTRLLQQLRGFVESLGGNPLETLRDYSLFTIVGAVLTPRITTIFGLGDGVYALNGELRVLQPSLNSPLQVEFHNAPSYLAYGLLDPGSHPFSPADLQLQRYQQCPTSEVQSLLVGTDGVMDLSAVAQQCLPGKTEPVGTLAQFWQNDRYFKNPDAVRRRLALINREVTQPNWQQHQLEKVRGLLPDDTTLICLRRRGELSERYL